MDKLCYFFVYSGLTVWTNQGGIDMLKSVTISKSVGIVNDELVCLKYCQESTEFSCDSIQFTANSECVLLEKANPNLHEGDSATIHSQGSSSIIRTAGHGTTFLLWIALTI